MLVHRCTLEPAKAAITTSGPLECSKAATIGGGLLLMLLHASEHIRLWRSLLLGRRRSSVKLSLWPATVHIRLLRLLLWGCAAHESRLRPLILRLLLLWEPATLCHAIKSGRVHRPRELLLLLKGTVEELRLEAAIS